MIGAALQRLSLLRLDPSLQHKLVIVRPKSDRLALQGECLHSFSEIQHVTPHPLNRYFNKWSFLGRDAQHSGKPILYLDWDVVATANCPLNDLASLDADAIWARPGPCQMYRSLLTQLQVSQEDRTGMVETLDELASVNAGLFFGSESQLRELADLAYRYFEHLNNLKTGEPAWKLEQFAACLALGDVNWRPLDDSWNVTPLSPVDDHDVRFWHYNDGDPRTLRLKRCLTSPDEVERLIHQLSPTWPSTLKHFQVLYQEACREPTLAPLLSSAVHKLEIH